MLEEEMPLEGISGWSKAQREELNTFQVLRSNLKQKVVAKEREDREMELKKEIERQKIMNEEVTRARLHEQKELEAVLIRQIEREEKLLERKLQMEKEAKELAENKGASFQELGALVVKLQRYIISPFTSDYKDWIWSWNQFSVEVDGSSISEISRFHYLLELKKVKPREDILGLPHTIEDYKEAERILAFTYGKDIKMHKVLIKELENLHSITIVNKTAS